MHTQEIIIKFFIKKKSAENRNVHYHNFKQFLDPTLYLFLSRKKKKILISIQISWITKKKKA